MHSHRINTNYSHVLAIHTHINPRGGSDHSHAQIDVLLTHSLALEMLLSHSAHLYTSAAASVDTFFSSSDALVCAYVCKGVICFSFVL